MNIKVLNFNQRSPECPLHQEQDDSFAREEKSRGGEDVITKGLMEVGEEERGQDPGTRVWLPGNQPQPPVALVTVSGGVWVTDYLQAP